MGAVECTISLWSAEYTSVKSIKIVKRSRDGGAKTRQIHVTFNERERPLPQTRN